MMPPNRLRSSRTRWHRRTLYGTQEGPSPFRHLTPDWVIRKPMRSLHAESARGGVRRGRVSMHLPANLDPGNGRLLSTRLTHDVCRADSVVRAQDRKESMSKRHPPLPRRRAAELTQEYGFLASSRTPAAQSGLRIVIEYANQRDEPQWSAPPRSEYTVFVEHRQVTLPDHRVNLAVGKVSCGRGVTSGPLTVSPGERPIRNSPASPKSQQYSGM